MKILSVGNFTGRGWDGSITDENHIADALEELGHTVIKLQREEWQIPGYIKDYDFTLIAQWDGYTNDHLKILPEPVVYWAFDYQADGQEWHEKLVKRADLYLSKRIADSKYPNWQFLSQDFAPKFLDKAPPSDKDIDVLFTGSYLPWATERNETLKAVDEKFNLVIHSVNGWPEEWGLDVRPPIMDEGLPELYARAKVVLSIDHTIEMGYWSDRPAQAMCCGAFVLHRYQPLSSSTFHSYIGYFYDIPTCLQSIEYWLEAEEDRENLAAWGYEYAQQNMKVRTRVEDLLNIVDSGLELVKI